VSSSDNFSSNEGSASPLKRVVIGIGTLLVITLMVFAAIFLAMADLSNEQPATPVAAGTPPIQVTPTTLPQEEASPTSAPPTNTQTPTTAPTDTPIPTLTFTATPEAAAPTNTPPAPTATFTPEPEPEVPTATATTAPAPPPPSAPPGGGVCAPPAEWVQYQVQVGDTLNSLSNRTGTTPFNLYEVNCLDSYTVVPGQYIFLPFTPPTPTASNTPTPVTPTPTPTRTGTPSPTPRAPEIFSSEPNVGNVAVDVILAVQGRYFLPDQNGFRAELRASGLRFELLLGDIRTQSSFEAIIPANTIGPGTYDLWIINPDDQFDIRRSAYTAVAE
jgi:LysM repeat protein